MQPIRWVALVLVLPSWMTSTFQTQSSQCHQLRQKCLAAENGCESVLNLLEDVCYSAGDSCILKDSTNCNKIIQFLLDQYPDFKDCICTKDNCSTKTFPGKQCFKNQGKSESFSPMDFQSNFLHQTKSEEEAHSGMKGNDCIAAKEMCQTDNSCFTRYKTFQRVCRAEVTKCNLQTVVQQCLTAWKALKATVLGNCTCPQPVQKRCNKIWKNIFNNTCLRYAQEYKTSTVMEEIHTDERTEGIDTDQRKIKSQWKSSALSNYEYKHRQSCFQVNVACVNDEVCNRQLALYLQVCQINGTQCDVHQCQAALQSFYKNMPFSVAQMMTFCDCILSDENCHQAKGLLHGKVCTVETAQTPSCLSVIHSCQANTLCWAKYEAFTSKCFKHISQACLHDKDCLQFLDTDDLICSDNIDCRAAYVDLWGSVLRVECSCDTTSVEEEPVCKWFHRILHSKSCFNQIAGGEMDLYPFYIDLPGEILPATGEQSLSYEDTIIIVIYISCLIPVLGIILLALLKTRTCTTTNQAKTVSPAHLAEKFMMPQQPWIINDMENALSVSSP